MTQPSSSKTAGLAKSYARYFTTAWGYAAGYRHWFIGSLTLGFAAQLLALVSPYALGQIINTLQADGTDGLRMAAIWLAVFGAGDLLQSLLLVPANRLEGYFGFQLMARLRSHLYRKLTTLPLAWHQDYHSGDIINRIGPAQSAIRNFAFDYKQILQLLTGFLGPVIVLTHLYPTLGLGALLAAVLIIFLTVKMGVKGRILRKSYNELDNRYGARRADYLSNIRTIITLRLQDQTAQDLAKRIDEIRVADTRDTNWQNWRWFSEGVFITLLTFGCIAYILLSLSGTVKTFKVGDLVIIVGYLRQMASSFSGFGFFYNALSRRLTDYEGIRYIEDAPASGASVGPSAVTNWQHLAIDGLTFAYKPDQLPQLDGLALSLQRGQKIALVGASGAGKSTLLTVLRGLYPTATGQVTVDAAHTVDVAVLGGLSTLIPQEPEIFENTIRFNITLGMDYPDADVMEACRIACFDTVLAHLPNGLDSDIREKGVNLSGGQKQRLALARGVFAIRNASLVLFDEPTSSVDSITERRIYANLLSAFPDICLISSIHRLHMLPLFDQVIVMDRGRIVQHGPVPALSQTPGLLRELLTAYHAVGDDLSDNPSGDPSGDI